MMMYDLYDLHDLYDICDPYDLYDLYMIYMTNMICPRCEILPLCDINIKTRWGMCMYRGERRRDGCDANAACLRIPKGPGCQAVVRKEMTLKISRISHQTNRDT